MKENKLNNYKCPICSIKWQEKFDKTGITQVFNSFAFDNYHNPEPVLCYKCQVSKDEDDKKGL